MEDKKVLPGILAVIKYFLRWMWKDHWVWTALIITFTVTAIFIDPGWSLVLVVICAIPGTFISWNLWYDNKRRRGKRKQ